MPSSSDTQRGVPMTKSLDSGLTKITHVRIPVDEKQAAIDVLREGETLSQLIRESLQREVRRRVRKASE